MMRVKLISLTVLISLGALAQDQDPKALEEKLAAERAQVAQLAEKEVGLLGQLAGLERLIELEGRQLKAATARLRVGARRLQTGEDRLSRAEDDLAARTRALGPRLTARYRMGREGWLRFLLGARSIGDVLRRRRLLTALVAHDIDSLAGMRKSADEAREARDELQAARDALARSAAVETDRRRELNARIDQQKTLLASVQDERSGHEQAVRELEEAAQALSKKLADLSAGRAPEEQKPAAEVEKPKEDGEPQAQAAAPFKKLRGKLLFPVEGGRVEVRFGRRRDPRFGTITLQRGIDVRAPEGTLVRAPGAGRVVHAGWFKGYGNLVIIDHGQGYYSLMAHLAGLHKAVGDSVRAGEGVGTVGDTGSLKGPYLYYELRDGQKPLDPDRWLSRKRSAAKPVRPKAQAGKSG